MINRLAKFIVNTMAAAATLSLVLAGSASAATTLVWNPGDVGVSHTVDFDGLSPVYFNASVPVPGLTSKLILTLDSIVGKNWTFSYDLFNTSSAPVTSSRVTTFGFDIPDYAGVTSTGTFFRPGTGAVPILGNRALCFRTIVTGGCSGSFFGGVAKGANAAGLFTLKLAAAQVNVQLSNFFVRYQGINAPRLCLCNQSGVGTGVVSAVPEPSTWAMMITGFGAIGMATRGRRRRVTTAA